MGGRLAIIACGGGLPVQIAKAHEGALIITLADVPNNFGKKINEQRLENLGGIFADLKAASVTRVVFAGALCRPVLEREKFDPVMQKYAPGIISAMQLGDDTLLRQVVEIFEEQGFKVIGAHELLPGLTAQADLHIGPPLKGQHRADLEHARDILMALSSLDVGQGCVVEKGQCLGVETLQGTDFMLKAVADTAHRPAGGGVFLKAAKRGQDSCILPTQGTLLKFQKMNDLNFGSICTPVKASAYGREILKMCQLILKPTRLCQISWQIRFEGA